MPKLIELEGLYISFLPPKSLMYSMYQKLYLSNRLGKDLFTHDALYS